MQEKDVVSIEYLEDPKRFADLLNGYVFEGQQVVRPEDIKERNRVITNTERRGTQIKGKVMIRDIMRKVLFGIQVVLIALEEQTDIHYAMPVRIMNAEAGIYQKQWKKRQAEHREKKDLEGAEFLSGFAKEDKLTPTLTLVVYFGSEPWDGPKKLKDMLQLEGLPEYLRDMIADYPIRLLEVRNYPHLEYFQTDIRYVFGFLQFASDKKRLGEYVEKNSEQFSDLEELAYDMIACMSKSTELKLVKQKYQKEKGSEIDMCKAITEMIEDGEKRGEKRGKERGVALAKKVYKAYIEGKSNETIAKECNISISRVKEILE